MSDTVSRDELRNEIWRKELYKDVIDGMYFTKNGLMGNGDNFIVQKFDDLKKSSGDTVTVPLTVKLSSGGIAGDSELEGNEEAISSYYDQIVIDQIRNAVRLTGKLDSQKACYDMKMDAKDKLSIWAQEFLERQIFMKLGGVSVTTLTDSTGAVYSARAAWSNTPDAIPSATEAAASVADYTYRYICADSAQGLDGLAATDVLTTALISKAKIVAKLANPSVRPLRIDGQDFYVMFIHPKQAWDLKNNTSSTQWQAAQQYAQVRGDKNPLFTGALGVWDGVILFEHEYVPQLTGNGTSIVFSSGNTTYTPSTVTAYRSLLCGRQAVGAAFTSDSFNMVEETFDYKNKMGYATGIIGGVQKMMFNSKNYGVVTVDTGATA
jgi:N4-gp56 family major capsid protein